MQKNGTVDPTDNENSIAPDWQRITANHIKGSNEKDEGTKFRCVDSDSYNKCIYCLNYKTKECNPNKAVYFHDIFKETVSKSDHRVFSCKCFKEKKPGIHKKKIGKDENPLSK